ncbi:MAG: hypothetical protein OXR64_10510 [Chloroflexota bacterium]|nr:hypothetical protein [Chloroflexota bacterium]MDE2920262.1 hypothetical protein [Chloroflexota bacterium]
MGKVAGLPVYQLLGGARSQIRGYASGGFYAEGKGEAELTREFGDYATRGFRAVKLNVGGLPIRDDASRVRVVRKALGPGIQLMIDANNQYAAKQALGMAATVEEFDIAWFEEPVPADDLEVAWTVRAGTPIPIAGYETETTRWAFRELITRGAVDIAQPDAVWAGGISEGPEDRGAGQCLEPSIRAAQLRGRRGGLREPASRHGRAYGHDLRDGAEPAANGTRSQSVGDRREWLRA